MAQVLNPSLNANSLKVAIAVAQFNDFITQNLLSGAESTLRSLGVQAENITVAWVPGAFELPLICKKFANSGRYDAVIALGCVIRGATSHYDLVCAEAAKGIAATSLQTGLPVIFGVITTDTIEQAIERAGAKAGNKGVDAAMAAVQMCSLLTQIEREPAFA